MTRSANALENIQRVADAGFVKPADIENIINNITGANGKGCSPLTISIVV